MQETSVDTPLRFTLPDRHARGRVARLGPVLDDILSAHDYPAAIKHVLAEAITLGALIGSLLKDEGGELTMQAQTDGGVIELLVADYRDGELRGHAKFDAARLADLGSNPSLQALFGSGFLAMTFDQRKSGQRYQGIVPLEGDTLAEACQTYFIQSEQVPTLIKLAVQSDADGCRSGGFLVQHLAEGEEGRERLHVRLDHPEWEHVAILAATLNHKELLDPALSPEALLWRLFHEEDEVRIEPGSPLAKGCRCTIEHFRQVLARFPEDERRDMVGEDGNIGIDCAFCSHHFTLDRAV